MSPRSDDSPSGIGEALERERVRQGLDMAELEERTKIRGKYLRALENEDWDVLPGPAYTRGFLRTYAATLGLDAEALVDDYRSRFEGPGAEGFGLPETVLRERRPLDAPGPWYRQRRVVVASLIAGLAALLLVLGLVGGSDDEDGEPADQARRERAANDGKRDRGEQQSNEEQATPDTVELKIAARSDSEVCLVSQGGDVLLDNSLMEAGDDESFEADTFDLSLGFGDVELTVNGEPERLKATPDAPLTWEIAPRRVRAPVADADPECP
jgi:cytoskeleton protein RodZ